MFRMSYYNIVKLLQLTCPLKFTYKSEFKASVYSAVPKGFAVTQCNINITSIVVPP